MSSDFGLTVRRHDRHQLTLTAIIGLGAHPAPVIGVEGFAGGRVRFSGESGISETGAPCTVVDLGAGGLGARTGVFYPRGALLRVRILDAAGNLASPRLDSYVRVQRVTMIDRKPTYLLGTAFTDRTPSLEAQVKAILAGQPAHAEGAPC